MTSPTLNIGWNKYEVVLLVDAYQRYLQEEWSRKDAVAILSKRLRARMQRLGSAVSETYRNENGISMQMSAIEYLFTDGQKGISHVSTLFREVFKMFNEEINSYDEMPRICRGKYKNYHGFPLYTIDDPDKPRAGPSSHWASTPTRGSDCFHYSSLPADFPCGYRS